MRVSRWVLVAGAAFHTAPALAADALKFGPAPAWVVPQAIPEAPESAKGRPVALLLQDQQIRFEPGKTVGYSEVAMKLQTPEGLAAGNISLPWDPAKDTITVNKLQIRRGAQIIDVLSSGQTFTTMRRETNLDLAMLDGVLTANIQPEGLQQGDVIDLAITVDHVDSVFGDHVESNFMQWGLAPIELAHLHLDWPSSVPLKLQAKGTVLAAIQRGERHVVELTEHELEPIVPPKQAPPRFRITRLGEATDFASWADLAKVTAPLYRKAEAIAATGPLHAEVEKIREAARDPKLRATKALELVQDRVRYVALSMGQGGYVPADAEVTWSRRFGDCKAKTALLLGILHSLGIEAEPIVVNAVTGDAIAERLPMISIFNHVLVRAHLAGKTYYLDGTRTGDTELDQIEVPDFGWGLPLVPGAKLQAMMPPPRRRPHQERRIEVDASAGVLAPATIQLTEIYRDDGAIELNNAYAAMTAAQKDEALRSEANGFFDGIEVASSSIQFDKNKRELNVTIKGTAKLTWDKGWFDVPTSTIAFTPDWARPAGPSHDAPIAVSYPRFNLDVATLKLPPGFASKQALAHPVHETLASVEYARNETFIGDTIKVESTERSLAPEVSYKEAMAAAPRLKALYEDDVYLRLPDNYRPTDADFAAMLEVKPASVDEYFRRADAYLNRQKTDEALSDLSAGLEIDPANVSALGKRAYINTTKQNYAAAEKDLAAVEALEPSNPGLPGARAMIAEAKGDYQACVVGYSKTLERQPNHKFALVHRAKCENALGKDGEALSDSASALKADPRLVELRILRANIFKREGKRDLVATEADALVSDNPTSDYAWVAAGRMYSAIGQRDRAMKAFDHALAIKQGAYIYINRAEVRPKSDVAGRVADVDAALKLEPNMREAIIAKARLLSDRGDSAGARALLARVKTKWGDPFQLYNSDEQIALLLLHKVRTAGDALKMLAAVDAKAIDSDDLKNACFTPATAEAALEVALQGCRKVLAYAPGNAVYLDGLGLALLRLGKLDEALAVFSRAIASGGGPMSLMGRAHVYLRKGDRSHAVADASAARKLSSTIDATYAEYGLKFEDASGIAPAKPH